MKTTSALVSAALIISLAGCAAPGTSERSGTEVGAVAGGIIGAIIGHQSGETAAGAAIGAVAGGMGGAAVGASRDRQEASNRRTERGMVSAQPVRDQHGYSLDEYMRLMTDGEMEILQARAERNPDVNMGALLTDQEKANLRRRASADREIGR